MGPRVRGVRRVALGKQLKQKTERKLDLRKVSYAGSLDRRPEFSEGISGSKNSLCKCPGVNGQPTKS